MGTPIKHPPLPLSPRGFGLSALGEGKSFLFPASAPAHTAPSLKGFPSPGIPRVPILVTQLPIRCRDRGQHVLEAPGGDAEYLWGQECEVCEAPSLEERSLLAMGPGQGKCFPVGEQARGLCWLSIILSSERKG